MKVEKQKDKIIIEKSLDFDVKETLECGQVFSFIKKDENNYIVISRNKLAKINIDEKYITINTNDVDYFYNYFDLDTDYSKIKERILNINSTYSKYLKFGNGIRILKQDAFQTIISFIVSANNNIKRIKNILFKISEKFGEKINGEDYYSFPNLNQLLVATKEDFINLGAGYRSEYLVQTINMLKGDIFSVSNLSKMNTKDLRKTLLTLKGVGPKVADCILLFGFYRTDVFPVDTWMKKAYYMFQTKKMSEEKIANYFVSIFKDLSGFAQQYLFNYMINFKNK